MQICFQFFYYKTDLPDKQIFKEMGAGNVNVEELYQMLRKAFNL
jgi:hypothetical protein